MMKNSKRLFSILLALVVFIFGVKLVMPVMAEASSRKCAVSDCNRNCDSGKYCRMHKCGKEGCLNARGDNGTIYCDTHAAIYAKERGYKVCSEYGCYRVASDTGRFCTTHTCIKSGCYSKRTYDSEYCSTHKPATKSTTTKKTYTNKANTSKSNSYKSSSKKTYTHKDYDPDDYDSPEDYADDAWGNDFDDWDDAYDYWENW